MDYEDMIMRINELKVLMALLDEKVLIPGLRADLANDKEGAAMVCREVNRIGTGIMAIAQGILCQVECDLNEAINAKYIRKADLA